MKKLRTIISATSSSSSSTSAASSTPIISTSSSSLSAATSVVIFATFSDVDAQRLTLAEDAVKVECVDQVLLRLKFDVAEALEAVCFTIADHTNILHLKNER